MHRIRNAPKLCPHVRVLRLGFFNSFGIKYQIVLRQGWLSADPYAEVPVFCSLSAVDQGGRKAQEMCVQAAYSALRIKREACEV